MSALRKDRLFRPTLAHLADVSGITQLEMETHDLFELRRVHDPFSNEHRRAVVVPDSGVTRDAAVFYRSISGNPNFELFSSLPAALSWLDLSATILPGYTSHDTPSSHATDLGRRIEIGLPERVALSLRGPQSH